jgi:hypothetical protein
MNTGRIFQKLCVIFQSLLYVSERYREDAQ